VASNAEEAVECARGVFGHCGWPVTLGDRKFTCHCGWPVTLEGFKAPWNIHSSIAAQTATMIACFFAQTELDLCNYC